MEKVINFYNNLSKKLHGNPWVYAGVILFVILLVYGIYQSKSAIKTSREELLQIQAQCEQQQMENDALSELLANSDSEYIERKAREELDYVLPGERVYIVRPGA